MFKFDDKIPIHLLRNLTVFWICFSESGCKIRFENSDEISIFYFDQFCNQNRILTSDKLKLMLSLLGTSIVNCQIRSLDKMCIDFSNGVMLEFYDRDDDFENYAIKIGGANFVV